MGITSCRRELQHATLVYTLKCLVETDFPRYSAENGQETMEIGYICTIHPGIVQINRLKASIYLRIYTKYPDYLA